MITATGNNFGAGTITFRAYSTEDILVLNGKVEVDVSSQAFLNASQLEIYLPNQPMRKSAETAVFMVGKKQGILPTATLVKCRLKNNNTLVIEKCRLYQYYGNFSLVFCCAMVPKGEVGPFTYEGATSISISSQNATVGIFKSTCVVREHWACIFLLFAACKTEERQQDFDFTITGLPNDISGEVPIINPRNSGYDGNPVMMATVNGPVFSVVSPSYDASDPYDGKFFKAFFVRGDNN